MTADERREFAVSREDHIARNLAKEVSNKPVILE